MFTGLIETIGAVRVLEQRGEGARLQLGTSLATELSLGESLAVNGCCLTVTDLKEQWVSFDLLGETLVRTNLGALNEGSRVNLERALRADGRFGGHFVPGDKERICNYASIFRKRGPATLSKRDPSR